MVTDIITRDFRVIGPETRAASNAVTRPSRPDMQEATSSVSESTNTPPPESQILAAVSEIEEGVVNLQRSLQFSVDEASGRTVITVSDRETGEVIREIPPEEVLAIAARMKEAAAGLLIAEEA